MMQRMKQIWIDRLNQLVSSPKQTIMELEKLNPDCKIK
jgi:hypothetical protein